MAGPYRTDTSKTLEQLIGRTVDDPADAPTGMVSEILSAWKKPLNRLHDGELWLLGSQRDGLPYLLDVIWPILERDPLHAFEHYEGDLLASLLRAPAETWARRPEYEAQLDTLKARALAAPDDVNDMFRENLAR